ncbi:pantetheine-phosphate adenylyltransferase, partial [Fusobacterium sp.]
MKIGVYAGSFDPITKGHQDIIERALKIVDRLIVVVMNNPKKTYWFDLEERKELIKKVFGENNKIEIEEYAGLLVEFMEKTDANLIIKGVRDMKDFSEEMVYSFANK